MQKLVTIALGGIKGGVKGVNSHLDSYFEDGWKVVSITPAGAGGGDSAYIGGWLAVLLEKDIK